MANARVHIIIKGHVQGVFFRSNTRKNAKKLNLTGWVRNKPDGTVEVIAEGEKEKLKKLTSFCKKGPSSARVDDIDVGWKEYKDEFDEFSVKY